MNMAFCTGCATSGFVLGCLAAFVFFLTFDVSLALPLPGQNSRASERATKSPGECDKLAEYFDETLQKWRSCDICKFEMEQQKAAASSNTEPIPCEIACSDYFACADATTSTIRPTTIRATVKPTPADWLSSKEAKFALGLVGGLFALFMLVVCIYILLISGAGQKIWKKLKKLFYHDVENKSQSVSKRPMKDIKDPATKQAPPYSHSSHVPLLFKPKPTPEDTISLGTILDHDLQTKIPDIPSFSTTSHDSGVGTSGTSSSISSEARAREQPQALTANNRPRGGLTVSGSGHTGEEDATVGSVGDDESDNSIGATPLKRFSALSKDLEKELRSVPEVYSVVLGSSGILLVTVTSTDIALTQRRIRELTGLRKNEYHLLIKRSDETSLDTVHEDSEHEDEDQDAVVPAIV